jgi:hypothetical protein
VFLAKQISFHDPDHNTKRPRFLRSAASRVHPSDDVRGVVPRAYGGIDDDR